MKKAVIGIVDSVAAAEQMVSYPLASVIFYYSGPGQADEFRINDGGVFMPFHSWRNAWRPSAANSASRPAIPPPQRCPHPL